MSITTLASEIASRIPEFSMDSKINNANTIQGLLEEHFAVLKKGLIAVEELMDDSIGVAGLHQSGDIAQWPDLRTGGRFEEWLVDFDKALEELR
jgi:hypothetical protein